MMASANSSTDFLPYHSYAVQTRASISTSEARRPVLGPVTLQNDYTICSTQIALWIRHPAMVWMTGRLMQRARGAALLQHYGDGYAASSRPHTAVECSKYSP
ncbi:hypothetical protein C8Q73DRAFT_37376 [Cubamyces lactineus]|nr:hypothetical protein C8Q73DRAFT_37376 [Cubamyces lactineus]